MPNDAFPERTWFASPTVLRGLRVPLGNVGLDGIGDPHGVGHYPVDLRTRRVAGQLQPKLFVERARDPTHRPNPGIRDLTPTERLTDQRQFQQLLGLHDMLTGRARADPDVHDKATAPSRDTPNVHTRAYDRIHQPTATTDTWPP